MQPELHVTSEAVAVFAGFLGGVGVTLNLQVLWRAIRDAREESFEVSSASAAEIDSATRSASPARPSDAGSASTAPRLDRLDPALD